MVREPFTYMTPGLYDRLSDRVIIDSYLAPRNKKGELIPYRRRHPDRSDEKTGSPDASARELPSAEELGVPPEAFLLGPPMDYTLMFWQTWKARTNPETKEKWTSAEVMKKFRAHILGG